MDIFTLLLVMSLFAASAFLTWAGKNLWGYTEYGVAMVAFIIAFLYGGTGIIVFIIGV